MDEAGVLSGPAEPCGDGKRALNHRTGVDVAARFELDLRMGRKYIRGSGRMTRGELSPQARFELVQPFEKHLVVVAGAANALLIDAAAPGITRNPPTVWGRSFS